MKLIPGLFEESELEVLRTLPEVVRARDRGITHFTATVPEELKQRLEESFEISLPSQIPFRFMTGDTPVHADVGARSFENTYLMYVTGEEGVFEVGEESYPVVAGNGFVFSEGTRHGVTQANGSSRLLVGPMSESGFPVGNPGTSITADGTTETIYIQQGDGIQYSINQDEWFSLTWPLFITNSVPTSTLKVLFLTDVSVYNTDGYIQINSNGIQIGDSSLKTNGTRTNITVDEVADYSGFVRNSGGYSNISIYNLNVDTNGGSTLSSYCGWVGGVNYGMDGTGNYIIGCSSTGLIPIGGGGIVGAGGGCIDGGESADLTILGCYSTGLIEANGGGIAGVEAGSYGGSITIIGCCSSGGISEGGGGIVGQAAATVNGTCIIQKCYSLGAIYDNAGGICGQDAAATSGTVTVEACFNSQLGGATGSGSILGLNSAGTITNCYTPGATLYGTTEGTVTTTNCYIADGEWSDADANAALANVSTVWFNFQANETYYLRNFGYTPYSLGNIVNNALVNTYTQSIVAGGSSIAGVFPEESTEFILLSGGDPSITIDSVTGVISTTESTPSGRYVLQLVGIIYPLFIQTTFTLIIPGPPTGSLETKGKEYNNTTYTTVQEGQRFVIERIERPNLRFNSFADYNKYLMARASFRS